MSTTRTNETSIEVDPKVPAVHIVREFDAPPEKVFRAHTDPELVVQWLGPRRHTMTIEHWRCETGGSYHFTHSSDGDEFRFFGSFHEVRPAELIVQTFTFEGFPDGVSLETMTFTDLGDGRTRIEALSFYDSTETRDLVLSSGMDHGVREGYERLDELLAG